MVNAALWGTGLAALIRVQASLHVVFVMLLVLASKTEAGPSQRRTFVTDDAVYVLVNKERADLFSEVMLKSSATLFKFDRSGKPDTSFGIDGKINILGNEKTASVEAVDLRIGADGKIYVGGNFAFPASENRQTTRMAVPGTNGVPLTLPSGKLITGPESNGLIAPPTTGIAKFRSGDPRFDKILDSIEASNEMEEAINRVGRVEAVVPLPQTTHRESRAGFVSVMDAQGNPIHPYGQNGTAYFPLELREKVAKLVPHADGRATVGVERKENNNFFKENTIQIVTLDSSGREIQTTSDDLRTELPGIFFERNSYKETSEDFARPTLGLEIGGLRDAGSGMELYANRLYREAPGKPLKLDTGFVALDHLFPDDAIRVSILSPSFDLQNMGLVGDHAWIPDTIPFRLTLDSKGVGMKHLNGLVRPLSTPYGPHLAMGTNRRVTLLRYEGPDEVTPLEMPKEMKSLQGIEQSGDRLMVWGTNGKRVIVTEVDPSNGSVTNVTKTLPLDCPLDHL